jgi:hypothetical protein
MIAKAELIPPKRVTDLVELKKAGAEVTCRPAFDVLPVDFAHRENQFQAFIFLCRYSVNVDGEESVFRKCYARGCPHNLCPHVSLAVMTANRYLQRDYRSLREVGIEIEEKLFSLDEMLVKYDDIQEHTEQLLTIHDYINIAKEGNPVSLEAHLETVPAVEHFVNEKNKQIFLIGYFTVDTLSRTGTYQCCLSCYPTQAEDEEKPLAVVVANQRLTDLYHEFDQVGIEYKKLFFEY